MYKKILLSLMFPPLFSSSESLCMDPVSASIFGAAAVISNTTTTVINNTGSSIHNCFRYFFPTSADKEDTAKADAAIAASKVDIAASQIEIEKSLKVLAVMEARKKFEKCAAESKPDCEKTVIGIPIDCLGLARALIACGGKAALTQIIVDLEDFGIISPSKKAN